MELRDIEYFAVLAKHRHLGRAAEALDLSQSAMSKSLRRLELGIGAKLVKRTPKGIELTAEGTTLLTHAHRLRSSLDDVRREVGEVKRGLAVHLRIAAPAGFHFHLIPGVCGRLIEQAPEATLRITEHAFTDGSYALRNGDLDFMVAEPHRALPEGLVQEHLYDDWRAVIASVDHRLAKQTRVELTDLVAERWLLISPNASLTIGLVKEFELRGLPRPRGSVSVTSTVTRLSLAASSNLLGYTWRSISRIASKQLPLVELNVPELATRFPVHLYSRKGAYLSPISKRFQDAVRTTAAEIFGRA